MPVSVRLPTVLRQHADGQTTVEASGSTMGEVVDDLVARYPGIGGHIVTGDGELQRFVNVYVNDEDIRYLAALATPVADGDEISILPAVAGG